MAKPHISLRLLCTAPDGRVEAFGGRKQIAVCEDHLTLGGVTIRYEPQRVTVADGVSYATSDDSHHLVDLELRNGVLRVAYAKRDGTTAEEYFRYEPFLPARSPNTLPDLVAYVNAARAAVAPALSPALVGSSDGSMPSPAPSPEYLRYADQLEPDGEWSRVAVHLPRVSFPPLCPACAKPVETVDWMTVRDEGFGKKTTRRWLVPVCNAHRRCVSVGGALMVDEWERKSSDLVFTLFDATYAEAFYRLNTCPPEQRESPDYADAPLYQAIAHGTRFVAYNYVISCITIVSLSTTRPRQIAPGASRLRPAIVPTLITLLLGWWAIPGGPIATIGALIVNLRGGIDITDDVAGILKGVPRAL